MWGIMIDWDRLTDWWPDWEDGEITLPDFAPYYKENWIISEKDNKLK